MQTDLSDGVRYLAGQGTIDAKRVCIVGASYGGYAAMAGPTLDPGVYRCAAAYAGISDMRSFAPWVRGQNGAGSQRYLIRFVGAESARDPSLSEISPALHVDKVNVPILLIHGKDDTVVPLSQSRTMANALKEAGKPVDLVVLDPRPEEPSEIGFTAFYADCVHEVRPVKTGCRLTLVYNLRFAGEKRAQPFFL